MSKYEEMSAAYAHYRQHWTNDYKMCSAGLRRLANGFSQYCGLKRMVRLLPPINHQNSDDPESPPRIVQFFEDDEYWHTMFQFQLQNGPDGFPYVRVNMELALKRVGETFIAKIHNTDAPDMPLDLQDETSLNAFYDEMVNCVVNTFSIATGFRAKEKGIIGFRIETDGEDASDEIPLFEQ